jgi:hypothetical protein
LRKCRHAFVAGERGAQKKDRGRRPRCFAEAHVEIKERSQAELAEQLPVSGFRGDVRSTTMVKDRRFETCERNDGRGRDKSVEQHRDPMLARSKKCTADRRKLPAAQGRRHEQRVMEDGGMAHKGRFNGGAFAFEPLVINAEVVFPIPISPTARSWPSGGTVRYPISTAARNASISIAGASVKSTVARSRSMGTTSNIAPATFAIWLIAAPPALKFATICAVTVCG